VVLESVAFITIDFQKIITKKEIEKELQKRVFIDQIELSIEYNLPLIVHIREASIDSFNILDKYRDKIRGVLHCIMLIDIIKSSR